MRLGPGLGAPPAVGGGGRLEEEQWKTQQGFTLHSTFSHLLSGCCQHRKRPAKGCEKKKRVFNLVCDRQLAPLSSLSKRSWKGHISTLPYSWHIHVTYPGQWGFRHFSRSFWEGVFFLIRRTEMVAAVLLVRCPELWRPSEESAMQCLTVKYKQSQGPPASENMEKATEAQINLTLKTGNLRTLFMWEI